MRNASDELLDSMAKMVAVSVRVTLDHLRVNRVPRIPTDYDVGTILKYDGTGVLLRLRLTKGQVTVTETHVFSAVQVAQRMLFSEALDAMVACMCLEFALHFEDSTRE
jgi:hypothetical protein